MGSQPRVFAIALTAFAAALTTAAPLAAEPAKVVGCWNVKVDLPWPISDKRARACFEIRNEKLTGKLRFDDKWKPMSNVAFDGKRLAFTGDGPRGKARFDGRLVNTNRVEGKVQVGSRERPFTARRAK